MVGAVRFRASETQRLWPLFKLQKTRRGREGPLSWKFTIIILLCAGWLFSFYFCLKKVLEIFNWSTFTINEHGNGSQDVKLKQNIEFQVCLGARAYHVNTSIWWQYICIYIWARVFHWAPKLGLCQIVLSLALIFNAAQNGRQGRAPTVLGTTCHAPHKFDITIRNDNNDLFGMWII